MVSKTSKEKILKGLPNAIVSHKIKPLPNVKGIKKPPVTAMTEGQCAQMRVSAKLTYESTVAVIDGDFSNIINTRYYNTKR